MVNKKFLVLSCIKSLVVPEGAVLNFMKASVECVGAENYRLKDSQKSRHVMSEISDLTRLLLPTPHLYLTCTSRECGLLFLDN